VSGVAVFESVLVAGRGEIAVRIVRTLRRLGIRSVAVYSDADASAPHVRAADEAVRLGPAPVADSYLRADAIVRAALLTGAQAVHPGYGFLSESPVLAGACADAGIVFVGPRIRALEIMGDKIAAREHVTANGVPVIPGRSGAGLDESQLADAAASLGFPLLIKPSAGGGGKGMQIARDHGDLPEALASARRVARAAFGDDALLLERLLERPRHIEVQVLGDTHGTLIHLGERECTLQRRHQKVIEEAPSPLVDAPLRERLGDAALRAAASVDYEGAGTVEFLVSADAPDQFFFIEMNTRLQVEHAVTELVTGIDLVEQQLRIAAGEPLPAAVHGARSSGHAIEARIYAEDPRRGFLPSTGTVGRWRAPTGEGVRVDAGIESGADVSAFYDPMVAKVIAHGADRAQALERLDRALAETIMLGIETNIPALRALLADPAVRAGELDTGLIERQAPLPDPAPSVTTLERAASAWIATRAHTTHIEDASPLWRARGGWRLGGEIGVAVGFDTGRGQTEVRVTPGRAVDAHGAEILITGDDVWIHADGEALRLTPIDRRAASARRRAPRDRGTTGTFGDVRSPMPGIVASVHVADGARVEEGGRILTIEAMKMEHPVNAPHAGIVRLRVGRGARVGRDEIVATLVVPEEPDGPGPVGVRSEEAPDGV
jgi:acetyl-CoA/propionyl-CoA carboxylase biotin carboxyl carrier protein